MIISSIFFHLPLKGKRKQGSFILFLKFKKNVYKAKKVVYNILEKQKKWG